MTFQARNLEESRFLYDQLAVMCAFMVRLALVACFTELLLSVDVVLGDCLLVVPVSR